MAEGWTVAVYGTPAPKGSLKCVGRGGRHQLIEDDKTGKGKPWRALVKRAGEQLLTQVGDQLLQGPVSIDVTLTLDRPLTVKSAARRWPWRRCLDTDKGVRMILDALQDSGLITDDAQVVELTARKAYPDTPDCPGRLDRPGAVIRVWPTERTLLDA